MSLFLHNFNKIPFFPVNFSTSHQISPQNSTKYAILVSHFPLLFWSGKDSNLWPQVHPPGLVQPAQQLQATRPSCFSKSSIEQLLLSRRSCCWREIRKFGFLIVFGALVGDCQLVKCGVILHPTNISIFTKKNPPNFHGSKYWSGIDVVSHATTISKYFFTDNEKIEATYWGFQITTGVRQWLILIFTML